MFIELFIVLVLLKGLKDLLPRMGEWGFKRGGVKKCKKIVDEGLADRCETINNWLCYSMRGQEPKGVTLCYYQHMLHGNVVYQTYTRINVIKRGASCSSFFFNLQIKVLTLCMHALS